MLTRMFATLVAVSLVGCAADPPDAETTAWPCGSIETGGYYGLANVQARYQYDDLNNVVWRQEINYEDSPNYGNVMATETSLFEGRIAFFEEEVAGSFHRKVRRELVDGRIVRETFTNYYDAREDVSTAAWTYTGDRVTRIDRSAVSFESPGGYSAFTYADGDTRIERSCNYREDGGEDCSTVTLVGGVDTWTTSREDYEDDGADDFEAVRVLDANGLPLMVEGYYLEDGVRTYQTSHVEIERRADGAPLREDNGFTQIEYLFECDAD